MFEGSPHPILIYDIETLRLLKVNQAFMRRYEYNEKEAERLEIMELCVPEDKLAALDFVRKVAGKPFSESGTWRQITKSGKVFYANITSHATIFKTRKARIIIITDIDEQMRAQNAIRSSEKKLKSLIDNTPDIIFMVDIGMNLVTYNAAFETIYNTSFPERDGLRTPMPVQEVPATMFGEKWLENIRLCMQGQTIREEDMYVVPTTGREICLDIVMNPIYDVNDQLIGVGCISRDISERKKTEEQMAKQLTQLREIAWIQSHELRQPLTNIMGLASLIEADVEDPVEVKSHVTLLNQACEKMDEVVRGIVKKIRG
jgi:PAS domain S-box-containing protein